jgi:type II secretory pathway predicted ATPase ExeA
MYPFSDIDDTYDPSGDIPREIFEEASIEASVDDMALSKTLNKEQQVAYNEIMSAVDSNHGGLFFVDGPGGTGKTYLYRALLATIRSLNKIVVATATSGGTGKTYLYRAPLALQDSPHPR